MQYLGGLSVQTNPSRSLRAVLEVHGKPGAELRAHRVEAGEGWLGAEAA